MNFFQDKEHYPYRINSYQDGIITINKTAYTNTLLILPDELIVPLGPDQCSKLSDGDFKKILGYLPQVLLVGTGSEFCYIPPEVYLVLTENKIGVEVMHTGAACRTFMLLMSERRRVAGLLFC